MKPPEKFSIPLPKDFSFEECLWFLNRDYDDCLHMIRNNEVWKAFQIGAEQVAVRIGADRKNLNIELISGNNSSAVQAWLNNTITEWFDLERDLSPFYRLLSADKKLSYMTGAFKGLRLLGINDLFEAICWSIIGQQINLTFAYKLKRRLVEAYGTSLSAEGEKLHIFPGCTVLAAVPVEELRAMQFSQTKAAYLVGIAGAFARKEMSKEILMALPSFEDRQKALTAFKGIGVWTANYALMKSLRVPDSIPYGDVGLLQALVAHNIMKDRADLEKMHRLFRKFRGWESYLVFYLWRSLSAA